MSRIDEGVGAADLVHIAEMVVRSHERGQRCQRCTDTGCDQVPWAQDIIDRATADPVAFRQWAARW